MRILHIHSGNRFGGVETFLINLMRAGNLCSDMHHSVALCFEGRLSDELKAAGVSIHKLNGVRISRPWTVWQARRQMQDLIKSGSFDLAICHNCWPQFIFGPVVKKCKIPLVFWAHQLPTDTHWLDNLAKRARPDLVIANSKYTQESIPKFYPGIVCEVVYYPINSPDMSERELSRRKVRSELSMPQETVIVIQVSRLARWKGHELLISSLAGIKDVADWICCIVGGPETQDEIIFLQKLQQKARQLGIDDRIRFLGKRNDVFSILLASDIFCQPNTAPEPFGISFIEALYAGLPVITTNFGGGAEIINESCGRLVPPNDLAALSGALRSLIVNFEKRNMLGKAGFKRAYELCNPGVQLSRLHMILSEAIIKYLSQPEKHLKE